MYVRHNNFAIIYIVYVINIFALVCNVVPSTTYTITALREEH